MTCFSPGGKNQARRGREWRNEMIDLPRQREPPQGIAITEKQQPERPNALLNVCKCVRTASSTR